MKFLDSEPISSGINFNTKVHNSYGEYMGINLGWNDHIPYFSFDVSFLEDSDHSWYRSVQYQEGKIPLLFYLDVWKHINLSSNESYGVHTRLINVRRNSNFMIGRSKHAHYYISLNALALCLNISNDNSESWAEWNIKGFVYHDREVKNVKLLTDALLEKKLVAVLGQDFKNPFLPKGLYLCHFDKIDEDLRKGLRVTDLEHLEKKFAIGDLISKDFTPYNNQYRALDSYIRKCYKNNKILQLLQPDRIGKSLYLAACFRDNEKVEKIQIEDFLSKYQINA